MGEGQATGFFCVRHLPPSPPTHTPAPCPSITCTRLLLFWVVFFTSVPCCYLRRRSFLSFIFIVTMIQRRRRCATVSSSLSPSHDSWVALLISDNACAPTPSPFPSTLFTCLICQRGTINMMGYTCRRFAGVCVKVCPELSANFLPLVANQEFVDEKEKILAAAMQVFFCLFFFLLQFFFVSFTSGVEGAQVETSSFTLRRHHIPSKTITTGSFQLPHCRITLLFWPLCLDCSQRQADSAHPPGFFFIQT